MKGIGDQESASGWSDAKKAFNNGTLINKAITNKNKRRGGQAEVPSWLVRSKYLVYSILLLSVRHDHEICCAYLVLFPFVDLESELYKYQTQALTPTFRFDCALDGVEVSVNGVRQGAVTILD